MIASSSRRVLQLYYKVQLKYQQSHVGEQEVAECLQLRFMSAVLHLDDALSQQ
jgi:hypothetical protein